MNVYLYPVSVPSVRSPVFSKKHTTLEGAPSALFGATRILFRISAHPSLPGVRESGQNSCSQIMDRRSASVPARLHTLETDSLGTGGMSSASSSTSISSMDSTSETNQMSRLRSVLLNLDSGSVRSKAAADRTAQARLRAFETLQPQASSPSRAVPFPTASQVNAFCQLLQVFESVISPSTLFEANKRACAAMRTTSDTGGPNPLSSDRGRDSTVLLSPWM